MQTIEEIVVTIQMAQEEASAKGARAGANSAEWAGQDLFGGRASIKQGRETANLVISAYEDGDYSRLPEPPNLSGEWAGDETPASLMASCFGEDWEDNEDYRDEQDNICSAWEQAAADAFYSRLSEMAYVEVESE